MAEKIASGLNPNDMLDLSYRVQMLREERAVSKLIDNPMERLVADQMCFYRVNKLSYDEDFPHREAFENVLSCLDDPAFNFVYILQGKTVGVDLYIGVVKNKNVSHNGLNSVNYGEIIANAFSGNFNGSKLEKLTGKRLEQMAIESVRRYKQAGVLMGIPSISECDNDYDFQGIDRLINSMLGLSWRFVVVCEPVNHEEIVKYREDVYRLYNDLYVQARQSFQRSLNEGSSYSTGSGGSDSRTNTAGYTESSGKSGGKNCSKRTV